MKLAESTETHCIADELSEWCALQTTHYTVGPSYDKRLTLVRASSKQQQQQNMMKTDQRSFDVESYLGRDRDFKHEALPSVLSIR